MPGKRLRAAIYCRISQDTGEGLGVARQEADCRELVAKRGWEAVEVLVDNDVSAFGHKRRPGYEALVESIERGLVDAVVAWHPDRLHRSPIELEGFIALVERTGVAVATCTAGDFDLATPEGRLTARITGSVARKESEDKSRRLRRKHLELAQAGKRAGGGRAFGYEPDGVTVCEAEADLIRAAAKAVLAGESLYSIVSSWAAAGVPTVRGGRWSTTALKGILTSARVAGLRDLRGEVVAVAEWPAILDRPTWERVRMVLLDPSRARGRPRSYPLSGLLRCGRCGGPMVGAPRQQRHGAGKRGTYEKVSGEYLRAYGCLKVRGGCGGVYVLAEPVEAFVVETVLATVSPTKLATTRRRLLSPVGQDERLLERIAADERMLETLGEDHAEGRLPRRAFLAAATKVQARLDDLRSQVARASRNRALDGLVDLAAEWHDLTPDRRRAVSEALLVAVDVYPATGVRNRFDPSRVVPRWRF